MNAAPSLRRISVRASLCTAALLVLVDLIFCGCSSMLPSARDVDRWHAEAQAVKAAFIPDFMASKAVRTVLAKRPGKKLEISCLYGELWIEASWPAGKTVTKDSHGRDVVTHHFEQRLTPDEIAALAAEAQRILSSKHLNASAVLIDARVPDKAAIPAAIISRYGRSVRFRQGPRPVP